MLTEILVSSAISAAISALIVYRATRRHETVDAQTVRARDFFVVDESGRTQASLGIGPRGPQLEIGGGSGKVRILLGMDKGIPKLVVADELGNDRLVLAHNLAGPSLHVFDAQQHELLSLRDNLVDGAALTFYGIDGKPKLIIGNVGMQPVMVMYNENGQAIWQAFPSPNKE